MSSLCRCLSCHVPEWPTVFSAFGVSPCFWIGHWTWVPQVLRVKRIGRGMTTFVCKTLPYHLMMMTLMRYDEDADHEKCHDDDDSEHDDEVQIPMKISSMLTTTMKTSMMKVLSDWRRTRGEPDSRSRRRDHHHDHQQRSVALEETVICGTAWQANSFPRPTGPVSSCRTLGEGNTAISCMQHILHRTGVSLAVSSERLTTLSRRDFHLPEISFEAEDVCACVRVCVCVLRTSLPAK